MEFQNLYMKFPSSACNWKVHLWSQIRSLCVVLSNQHIVQASHCSLNTVKRLTSEALMEQLQWNNHNNLRTLIMEPCFENFLYLDRRIWRRITGKTKWSRSD